MPELAARLQDVLGTAFRVERELGGGGMSRVFVARDAALGRDVVVKVLPPTLAATVSAERFRREIMVSAGLQHPNIVPVLSAGEVPADAPADAPPGIGMPRPGRDALPYYVMPFVKGESLRVRLQRGPLSIRETVGVLKDVARALAFAHGRGVVHRDIKPDNILLATGTTGGTGGGAATVADFGVAKAISAARMGGMGGRAGAPPRDGSGTMTGAGISLGTPAYMAPEQAVADPNVDQRADLYSLGVVAYEMLVGVPPFHGRAPHAVLAAHLAEEPPPIGARRYDVPEPLVALVMACLQKDPAHRPKSAGHLLRLLDDAATSMGPASATGARRRSRWPTAAGSAVVVAALAAGAWALWGGAPADDAIDGAADPAASPVATPPRVTRAVVVVPLRGAGGDARAAAVAEGLTSELVAAISRVTGVRVTGVRVAARPAPPSPADSAPPVADVLVEGTVQRDGERLRVTVRLVDPRRDSTMWATTESGSADAAFALQDVVTRAVAAALGAMR